MGYLIDLRHCKQCNRPRIHIIIEEKIEQRYAYFFTYCHACYMKYGDDTFVIHWKDTRPAYQDMIKTQIN